MALTKTLKGEVDLLKKLKLNISDFELKYAQFEEQVETIRFAVYDNFRVQKATENYIEKYLPFTIQNMISRNIYEVLPNPQVKTTDEFGDQLLDYQVVPLTGEEEAQADRFRKFKQFEYECYKEIHKTVLGDDGNPTLKKTGFRMPGYRKIITQEEQYEIDNEIAQQRIRDRLHQDTLKSDRIDAYSEEIVPDSERS